MSQQIIYFHFINLFNHKFYDDYYYNLSSYSAKVLVIFQKKLCIRLRLIMAFSAGRTLVRVNKQVNRALVTDHDPSESSFYLLHVIILAFTRNKNHYHFFSNKTLETDVPVHVNFVFRPVWSCHMQTKIARLICRPQATTIHSRALTKLVFDLKKKRNYLLADNKLLYCFFSATNAHEGVGWGSVAQFAACCWWLSNSRLFNSSSHDFFLTILLIIIFFLTPFRHKLRWPWTSGHTIMIRYLITTMSFQILRRGNACDFTTTTFSMLSAQC